MKYLKTYEDLKYTQEEEKDYIKKVDVILKNMSTTLQVKKFNNDIKCSMDIITDSKIDKKDITYGKIKLKTEDDNEMSFVVYLRNLVKPYTINESYVLDVYKPANYILDDEAINILIKMFKKCSIYFNLSDSQLHNIIKILNNKVKNIDDHLNTTYPI